MKYRQIIRPESEAAIQAAFFSWCELSSNKFPELNLFHSIPNGSHKGYASRYLHKVTGLKPGVPDTFLPVARCGFHGLYIEFKSAKGRVRDEQKIWIAKLTEQGYLVRTCRDTETAIEIAKAYVQGNLAELERISNDQK